MEYSRQVYKEFPFRMGRIINKFIILECFTYCDTYYLSIPFLNKVSKNFRELSKLNYSKFLKIMAKKVKVTHNS